MELGALLADVKAKCWYSVYGFTTFEAYVLNEADASKRSANEWMLATRVVDKIKSLGIDTLPGSLQVCKVLGPLVETDNDDVLAGVWTATVEHARASDTPITPKLVASNLVDVVQTKEDAKHRQVEQPSAEELDEPETEDETADRRCREAYAKFQKGVVGYNDLELKPNVVDAILDRETLEAIMREIATIRRKIKDLAGVETAAFLVPKDVDVSLEEAWRLVKASLPWMPCGYCLQKGCDACTPGLGKHRGTPLGWLPRDRFKQNESSLKTLVSDK